MYILFWFDRCRSEPNERNEGMGVVRLEKKIPKIRQPDDDVFFQLQ
jgi:hypothetical protein